MGEISEQKEEILDFLKKKYELNNTDYKIFKEEILFWQNYYGLKTYEIATFFENIGNFRAEATTDHESMISVVILNKKWDATIPDDYNIRKAAYHEICEIMLSKLVEIARSRTTTSEQIEQVTHEIIKIMENTHFEDSYRNRF